MKWWLFEVSSPFTHSPEETAPPSLSPGVSPLVGVAVNIWTGGKSAAELMKPKTVLQWHGHAFLKWWRWKSRRNGGRPTISPDILLATQTSDQHSQWESKSILYGTLDLYIETLGHTCPM